MKGNKIHLVNSKTISKMKFRLIPIINMQKTILKRVDTRQYPSLIFKNFMTRVESNTSWMGQDMYTK